MNIYTTHKLFLVILFITFFIVFYFNWLHINLDLYHSSIVSLLGITGTVSIASLSIILSTKIEFLRKIDFKVRKPQIEVIFSYYKFNIIISIITILLLLLKNPESFFVLNILIETLIIISIVSVYFCLKILFITFNRK